MIDGKYRKMFLGVLEKDHEMRERLMAPYNEWLDEREEGSAGKDVKSVATRVQRCKDQMATMVCNMFNLSYSELIYVFFFQAESWSNLEDIEVVGAVMYIGNDPAGAQTSGVFGGSENVRGYINDNHVNIRQMLSNYTTVLR
jgi:hypothetical protein